MVKTVQVAVVTEESKETEYKNILRPILRLYPCDRVVLLKHKNLRMDVEPDHSDIELYLKPIRNTLDVEERYMDVYDFEDTFNKTVSTIRKHLFEGYEVLLNLSDASKIGLMAMMSAAYFVPRSKNLKVVYSKSEKDIVRDTIRPYQEMGGRKSFIFSIAKDYSQEENTIDLEVPIFPTKKVPDTDEEIMGVLYKREGVNSIKELIQGLKVHGQEMKRSSLQYRLNKLENMGMIEREPENRKVVLDLTATGKMYMSSKE